MGNTDDEFEKFLKESMTASDGVSLGGWKNNLKIFCEILNSPYVKCYPRPYVKQEFGTIRMEFIELGGSFPEEEFFEDHTRSRRKWRTKSSEEFTAEKWATWEDQLFILFNDWNGAGDWDGW